MDIVKTTNDALTLCENVVLNPNITWEQESADNVPINVVRAVRYTAHTNCGATVVFGSADDPAGDTHTCGVCALTLNGQFTVVRLPDDFVAYAISVIRQRMAELN